MSDLTPIAQGIAAADSGSNGPEYPREQADVKRWFQRIDTARKFDDAARKQYALDRRHARGDSGHLVGANIIGTFIDILSGFLYAKDPDVDVLPARCTQPPSLEALRDAAEDVVAQSPEIEAQAQQAGLGASWQAIAAGIDPQAASMAAVVQARAVLVEQAITAKADELQKRYARRQRDNKAFAETLELVVSRLWRDGKLKSRGRTLVRSGLTVGVGWIKASWQERTGQDPQILHRIADLKDNIAKAVAQREALEDASGDDLDAQRADYERQLQALEGDVERVIARGFAIDFVPAEDVTVAAGLDLTNYLDAPWIAHRVPMLADDATAEFKLDREKAKRPTRYSPRKPETMRNESPAVTGETSPEDADSFLSALNATGESGEDAGDYVMVHEIWDRDSNSVLTGIEGLDCWAKAAYQPDATSRFYPLFLLAFGEVDGQRHPQSLVTRSAKLVDEYNRIGTQEAEHRRRIKPKTGFNAGLLPATEAAKLENAVTGEMVGLTPTNPNTPIGDLLHTIAYPPMDPALYDRSRIIGELERIWGIQEALSQSISTEKTATEAEIQQTGFQVRTGAQRDVLEAVLNDLALYTAEVAWQHMSDEDVRRMVGPDAMWPEWDGPESLPTLVNVEIRAGSSGKPNTSAERQAWATLLPLLQNGISMIGQLRQSDPADVADSMEELLRITAERSGDRLDIDQLVPQAGTQPVLTETPQEPADVQ